MSVVSCLCVAISQYLGVLKPVRRRNIFAYIDARDLGHMVHQCLLIDGLGFEICNVSNDDHSVEENTEQLIETYYQGVPASKMGLDETFYSNKKAKRLLGYSPKHSWRMYVDEKN